MTRDSDHPPCQSATYLLNTINCNIRYYTLSIYSICFIKKILATITIGQTL